MSDRQLSKIATVDDDGGARETMAEKIHDLFNAEPVLVDEKKLSPDRLLQIMTENGIEAAIVDSKLSVGGYSQFDGIDFVADLTGRKIPAVLASSYPPRDKLIWHGRDIPAVVEKGNLGSSLVDAMQSAVARSYDFFTPETKPETTIVRITALDDDDDEVGLIIPAFSPTKFLLVGREELKKRLGRDLIEGLRFFAEVNIGAKSVDGLYLSNLSEAPELEDKYAKLLRS
jgi:hypothetical protein